MNYKIEDGVLISASGRDSEITIPQNVKILGIGSFEHQETVKKVYLHDGITEIMGNAFYGCKQLQQIRFSENLESIGPGAFHYCRNLESVHIPSSVTVIGEQAFMSTGLREIIIPKNIEQLGDEAFAKCPYLKKVRIETNCIEYYGSFDEDDYAASIWRVLFLEYS